MNHLFQIQLFLLSHLILYYLDLYISTVYAPAYNETGVCFFSGCGVSSSSGGVTGIVGSSIGGKFISGNCAIGSRIDGI